MVRVYEDGASHVIRESKDAERANSRESPRPVSEPSGVKLDGSRA